MKKIKYFDEIRSPVMTEKSNFLTDIKKYSFFVDKRSTKHSVKDAIESIYDVKVKAVNIINYKPKKVFFKGKVGFKNSFKKAIVTLLDDYSIDYIGGIK